MRHTAAIACTAVLLTACSGGDIVVKTDLGESYIVKDSAVTELDPPINRRIKYYEDFEKIKQNSIADLIKASKECSSDGILSQARCDEIYLSDIPDEEKKIKDAKDNIKLLQEAAASEKPWFKQVRYRPIFIDLNNNKKAMGYITITCMSPETDTKKVPYLFHALDETETSTVDDLSKAYYQVALKVCDKYAYKNALRIFALRESSQGE